MASPTSDAARKTRRASTHASGRTSPRAAPRTDSRPTSARTRTRKKAANALTDIRLTNPDKVLYPDEGISKRQLAEYLQQVAPRMLPHVANRLLTLVRCPQGSRGSCFYQRHHGDGMPDGLRPVAIRERKGRSKAPYIALDDAAGLMSLAQIGVLEVHLWGSSLADIEKPDRLVFDLDPDPTLDFDAVRAGAFELRRVLEAAELQSFPLLTGGKGLHLVLPLRPHHDWDTVKGFARGIAGAMTAEAPDRFIAKASKASRTGKIFIDWLRNDRSATAIAPFSTRTHRHCPIAVPVSWRELPRITAPDQYTINNIGRRLSALRRDPWDGYFDIDQVIPSGALALFR